MNQNNLKSTYYKLHRLWDFCCNTTKTKGKTYYSLWVKHLLLECLWSHSFSYLGCDKEE
uniref:Uncharacterized protein n=1 Tax=Picea sitchensis TaxID=3332 RepID=B8LPR2_PICSI|nr:unknown [Picea sitchensis]